VLRARGVSESWKYSDVVQGQLPTMLNLLLADRKAEEQERWRGPSLHGWAKHGKLAASSQVTLLTDTYKVDLLACAST
jgi:hypothetical protein